jgi:MinD superfamily P-loop ATPase
MKQIVVISGKGGTGKTMLTGAFAALAEHKIMVDCDVDAANLHLLLHPSIQERHIFKSGAFAKIDPALCTHCGECKAACRFQAISPEFAVSPIDCEGCGLCARLCPVNAIRMKESTAGEWFISETRYGPFVHAKLGIAEENSGKLVAKVRETAKQLAEKNGATQVIIDGPPGIGCPVIASLSGVDLAVIVTEPSLSGAHDAGRVMDLARHFDIPVRLVINKWDIHPQGAEEIERFCASRNVPVIGKIPFSRDVMESVIAGKPITEYSNGALKNEIIHIWEAVKA